MLASGILVLPFCNSLILFWTAFSLSLSKALITSSNDKITGFFKKEIALANLCIFPPETGSSLVKNFYLILQNIFIFILIFYYFFEYYIFFTEFE